MDADSNPAPQSMTLEEFVANLQAEDGGALADGIKRCRDAIARAPTATQTASGNGDDASPANKSLAEQYLDASPEAAEVFTIWDSIGKDGSGRVVTVVVDLLGVLVSFAPDHQAEPLAWKLMRTKAKSISNALVSKAPRLIRCTLKLLSTIVLLSPSLAREAARRISIPTAAVERLATTRHDSGLEDETGVGGKGGKNAAAALALSKRASRAVKAAAASADSGSLAKHTYLHGRAGDDVRACYVGYVCALLQCGAPDVVRETLRSRHLILGMLRGIERDPPSVALDAIGALGAVLVLAGHGQGAMAGTEAGSAVPYRAVVDTLTAPVLGQISSLYTSAAATASTASASGDGAAAGSAVELRQAVHAFLVGISTGFLPAVEDLVELTSDGQASGEAGPALGPVAAASSLLARVSSRQAEGSAAVVDAADADGRQSKRTRLADGSAAAGSSVPASSTRVEQPSALCVFMTPQQHRAAIARAGLAGQAGQAGDASASTAVDADGDYAAPEGEAGDGGEDSTAAEAGPDGADVTDTGEDEDGEGQHSGGLYATDADAEEEAAALKLVDRPGKAGASGGAGKGRPASGPSSTSLGYPPGALQLIVSLDRPSEDRLQADLVLRLVRAYPRLALPLTRSYPLSLEPRPSQRWLANTALYCALLEQPQASAAVAGPARPGPTPLLVALGASLNRTVTVTVTISGRTVQSVHAVAAGDGPTSIGGIPTTLLARALVPAPVGRALLVRALLHANPAIALHGCALLGAVLRRVGRAVVEACTMVPVVNVQRVGPAPGAAGMHGTDADSALQATVDAAVSSAIHHARASRAGLLARAIAPLMPDVQTLVNLRGKALAMLNSSSNNSGSAGDKGGESAGSSKPAQALPSQYDLSMRAGEGGVVAPGSASAAVGKGGSLAVSGLVKVAGSDDEDDSASSPLVLSRPDLGRALYAGVCDTLASLVDTCPVVLGQGHAGAASGSGSSGFDLLKLLPVDAATLTSLDSANHGPSAVPSLVRLLGSLPGPTGHEDAVARWIAKPPQQQGQAAAVASSGKADALAAAVLLDCPLAALLRLCLGGAGEHAVAVATRVLQAMRASAAAGSSQATGQLFAVPFDSAAPSEAQLWLQGLGHGAHGASPVPAAVLFGLVSAAAWASPVGSVPLDSTPEEATSASGQADPVAFCLHAWRSLATAVVTAVEDADADDGVDSDATMTLVRAVDVACGRGTSSDGSGKDAMDEDDGRGARSVATATTARSVAVAHATARLNALLLNPEAVEFVCRATVACLRSLPSSTAEEARTAVEAVLKPLGALLQHLGKQHQARESKAKAPASANKKGAQAPATTAPGPVPHASVLAALVESCGGAVEAGVNPVSDPALNSLKAALTAAQGSGTAGLAHPAAQAALWSLAPSTLLAILPLLALLAEDGESTAVLVQAVCRLGSGLFTVPSVASLVDLPLDKRKAAGADVTALASAILSTGHPMLASLGAAGLIGTEGSATKQDKKRRRDEEEEGLTSAVDVSQRVARALTSLLSRLPFPVLLSHALPLLCSSPDLSSGKTGAKLRRAVVTGFFRHHCGVSQGQGEGKACLRLLAGPGHAQALTQACALLGRMVGQAFCPPEVRTAALRMATVLLETSTAGGHVSKAGLPAGITRLDGRDGSRAASVQAMQTARTAGVLALLARPDVLLSCLFPSQRKAGNSKTPAQASTAASEPVLELCTALATVLAHGGSAAQAAPYLQAAMAGLPDQAGAKASGQERQAALALLAAISSNSATRLLSPGLHLQLFAQVVTVAEHQAAPPSSSKKDKAKGQDKDKHEGGAGSTSEVLPLLASLIRGLPSVGLPAAGAAGLLTHVLEVCAQALAHAASQTTAAEDATALVEATRAWCISQAQDMTDMPVQSILHLGEATVKLAGTDSKAEPGLVQASCALLARVLPLAKAEPSALAGLLDNMTTLVNGSATSSGEDSAAGRAVHLLLPLSALVSSVTGSASAMEPSFLVQQLLDSTPSSSQDTVTAALSLLARQLQPSHTSMDDEDGLTACLKTVRAAVSGLTSDASSWVLTVPVLQLLSLCVDSCLPMLQAYEQGKGQDKGRPAPSKHVYKGATKLLVQVVTLLLGQLALLARPVQAGLSSPEHLPALPLVQAAIHLAGRVVLSPGCSEAWWAKQLAGKASNDTSSSSKKRSSKSSSDEEGSGLTSVLTHFVHAALARPQRADQAEDKENDSSSSSSSSSSSGSDSDSDEDGDVPKGHSSSPSLLSLPGLAALVDGALARLLQAAAGSGTSTTSLGLAPLPVLHAALACHPTFLYLLLRDEYSGVGRWTGQVGQGKAGAKVLAGMASEGQDRAANGPSTYDGPRQSVSRLLLRLALADGSAATVPPPLLPILASAYTATLSPTDRCLRALLQQYSIVYGSSAEASPSGLGYAWSSQALQHVRWDAPLLHAAVDLPGCRAQAGAASSSKAKKTGKEEEEEEADKDAGTDSIPFAGHPSSSGTDWLWSGETPATAGAAGTGAQGPNAAQAHFRRRGGAAGRGRGRRQPKARPMLAFVEGGSAAPPQFTGSGLAGAHTGILVTRASASVSAFPVHRGLAPENMGLQGGSGTAALAPSATSLGLLPQGLRLSDSGDEASRTETSGQAVHTRARAHVYDPSWILPALLHAAAAPGGLSRAAPARRFVSTGGLAYCLACTTSSHVGVRQAGYAVLGMYWGIIAPGAGLAGGQQGQGEVNGHSTYQSGYGHKAAGPVLYKEQTQVALLLAAVRASVPTPMARLPSGTVAWVTEAAHILLKPTHPAYGVLNRSLAKLHKFDPTDVPLLYACLLGPGGAGAGALAQAAARGMGVAAALQMAGTAGAGAVMAALAGTGGPSSSLAPAASFMLRVLMRGHQEARDHAAMRRRHGYHVLLALGEAALSSVGSTKAAGVSVAGGGASGAVGTSAMGLVTAAGAAHAAASGAAVAVLRAVCAVLLRAARLRTPAPASGAGASAPGAPALEDDDQDAGQDGEDEDMGGDDGQAQGQGEGFGEGEEEQEGGLGGNGEGEAAGTTAGASGPEQQQQDLVSAVTAGQQQHDGPQEAVTLTPGPAIYLRRSVGALAWAAGLWKAGLAHLTGGRPWALDWTSGAGAGSATIVVSLPACPSSPWLTSGSGLASLGYRGRVPDVTLGPGLPLDALLQAGQMALELHEAAGLQARLQALVSGTSVSSGPSSSSWSPARESSALALDLAEGLDVLVTVIRTAGTLAGALKGWRQAQQDSAQGTGSYVPLAKLLPSSSGTLTAPSAGVTLTTTTPGTVRDALAAIQGTVADRAAAILKDLEGLVSTPGLDKGLVTTLAPVTQALQLARASVAPAMRLLEDGALQA